MAGKTISAYTDAETASLVADLARLEHRPQAQIAGQALKLFVRLPKEAHDALRQIEMLGSPEDFDEIARSITRTVMHAQYELAHRQVMETIQVRDIEQLETEDDILNAAIALTR